MLVELLNKREKLVVGLMSGTSLDGIDAAIVRIAGAGIGSKAELVAFSALPYEDELRERLKAVCTPDESSTPEVCGLNFYLGHRFAAAVRQAVREAGLRLEDIDLIASHGQTVWHIPVADADDKYLVRSTLQIGDISVIAKETGIVTVGDFRTADMAVGGQGAPLAPYADFLLLRDETRGRIAQNVGGIGNCAAIPAAGRPKQTIAFDTGPGNMIIDQAVYELSGGTQSYDEGGRWAAQGKVRDDLLAELLAHPYFALPPVKTTGREMFGKTFASGWMAKAQAAGAAAADIVATATAFTAHSIADSYRQFVFPHMEIHDVIVSGGGARNGTLMRMLAELLPAQRVIASDEFGLSGDAKEAIAFALLGNNFVHGIPNNLPSATGASMATVMGKLALP
ncbi:anhydro-N-acetylmuramic acid kinase [Gordoniibacillus kamchatkensis]|uniref:Anhydro-N-acetylmuramic acid kinase n=1 Tax=Gordoniibacillus kamchatkensis TaxID=1590651 RepID=A0ABR5AMY9_9BACL|nr:anhydro-N-acetylmuramic acid kinase [Paenibacillus sp. VKM B-2647]KIL42388.1 anhydro-N-acetylmuramic acid kinase [Paenibacillus sp. VKM B-2647]